MFRKVDGAARAAGYTFSAASAFQLVYNRMAFTRPYSAIIAESGMTILAIGTFLVDLDLE